MTVSLTTIAKKLKISPMTVSRVVNNSGPVRDATRERVLEAVRDMGYRRDMFASVNAEKRGTIKRRPVVALEMTSKRLPDYFRNIAFGVIDALGMYQFSRVVTSRSGDRRQYESDLLNADALVFCSIVDAATIADAKAVNPKLKIISLFSGDLDCVTINPDNERGGIIAAEHLLAKGHSRVAVFSKVSQPNHQVRVKAFMQVIGAASGHIEYVNRSSENVKEQLEKCICKKSVTAFFCPNSHETVLLCNYLISLGIQIPDDVGILGFDNERVYRSLPIPLSRVVFDQDKFDTMSAEAIAKTVEGKLDLDSSILVPVSMIDKGSIVNRNEWR